MVTRNWANSAPCLLAVCRAPWPWGCCCRWGTGRLSFPDVLKLLFDVATCLETVHAANTVHRDIKPENILFMLQSRCVRSNFGLLTKLQVLMHHQRSKHQ